MRRCFAYIFLLLFDFFLHATVQAADKIRIGFPDLAAPFVPLTIGDKRGFFQEEGIHAESIRMNPAVALQALVAAKSIITRCLALAWPLQSVEFR
jgi:ABC-type nitrate/sulfonate/bicarbonate transport system substrate-binding protein